MKKILATLLIVCTLFTTTVYAASVDVTSMTTDDLLELKEAINSEILKRFGTEGDSIYTGKYIVGEDIKSGMYVITFPSKNSDYDYGQVIVYPTVECEWSDREVITLRIGEEGYLELNDGNVIDVSYLTGVIRPITKPSWAP